MLISAIIQSFLWTRKKEWCFRGPGRCLQVSGDAPRYPAMSPISVDALNFPWAFPPPRETCGSGLFSLKSLKVLVSKKRFDYHLKADMKGFPTRGIKSLCDINPPATENIFWLLFMFTLYVLVFIQQIWMPYPKLEIGRGELARSLQSM